MGEINSSTSAVLSDGDSRNSVTICDGRTYSVSLKRHYLRKLKYVTESILNICGSIIIVTNLLSTSYCMLEEEIGKSHLISALFAGAGLSYVLLEITTNKLIVNGGSRMGYSLCVLALLDLRHHRCPGTGDIYAMGIHHRTQEWQDRLRFVQGAAVITCIVQFFIGSIIGIRRLVTYIRPVTIAPTMLLISISVIRTTAVTMADANWILFFASASFMFLSYSTYVMYCHYSAIRTGGCNNVLNIRRNLHIGVLCLLIIWIVCVILSSMEYMDRETSVRADVFHKNISAVRLSYSFQWGSPKWEIGSILLVLPASFVSIFEVLATYYNRCEPERDGHGGVKKEKRDNAARSSIICWEAVFCLLNVTMGTTLEVTIGFKKQNQTYAGFIIGVILFLIALSGTLCSVLAVVPGPIVSALIFCCFLSILFEGLNVMQSIDFVSTENLYIFASSIFMGFVIPALIKRNTSQVDQQTTLLSLLSIEFVVTGIVAIVLDNLSRVLKPKTPVLPVNAKLELTEENKIQKKNTTTCYDCLSSFCA